MLPGPLQQVVFALAVMACRQAA